MFDSYQEWLECVYSDVQDKGEKTIAVMLGVSVEELEEHLARYNPS